MENLSHWDFAADFTGAQATALIFGQDLNAINGTRTLGDSLPAAQTKLSPVFERMKHCYNAARNHYVYCLRPREDFDTPHSHDMLESVEMLQRLDRFDPDMDHFFWYWLTDNNFSGFDSQRFSRAEITRWLAAIGQTSVYAFNPAQAEAVPAPTGRWPWGDHHTEMLGHLEAAARRYWVGYDPADVTTASTNVTVIKWLQTERKLSKKMAEAIATMLRLDGLPTGPRK